MGKVILDSREITLEEFRKIEEIYKKSKAKQLRKIKEGVYKTLIKLEELREPENA